MASCRQHVSCTRCWSVCCMVLTSCVATVTLLSSFASMVGISSSSGLMTCLYSQLLMSWTHYVPSYCLDSKAGMKAKLDMSWAWKSCVIEKHEPSPSHSLKRSQIYCLPMVLKVQRINTQVRKPGEGSSAFTPTKEENSSRIHLRRSVNGRGSCIPVPTGLSMSPLVWWSRR